MLQYLKNIFINNAKEMRNILLFAFLLMLIYYHEKYFDYNIIIELFNADLIVKIILMFFIFFTAIANRLIYEYSYELLFSYLFILIINNYLAIHNLNILITILFLFIILYIKIILVSLKEQQEDNQKHISKNMFIEFIIDQCKKYSTDKYIVGIISMWISMIDLFYFWFILVFITTPKLNFIINWLILFFLFRVFFLNSFLYRNLDQILQNKIAIFESSEYQNFIKINKLLINENFIFSIAFVYMIAFIYHVSLVHEYLYCIIPSSITILLFNYLKKYLIK